MIVAELVGSTIPAVAMLVLSLSSMSGPCVPSSPTPARLEIESDEVKVLETVTANLTVPDAPAARLPIAKLQMLPAEGAPQIHRGSELAAKNVVFEGTISTTETPVASIVPMLE